MNDRLKHQWMNDMPAERRP